MKTKTMSSCHLSSKAVVRRRVNDLEDALADDIENAHMLYQAAEPSDVLHDGLTYVAADAEIGIKESFK